MIQCSRFIISTLQNNTRTQQRTTLCKLAVLFVVVLNVV